MSSAYNIRNFILLVSTVGLWSQGAFADCAGYCNSQDWADYKAYAIQACEDVATANPGQTVGPYSKYDEHYIGQGATAFSYGCLIGGGWEYMIQCCVQVPDVPKPPPPKKPVPNPDNQCNSRINIDDLSISQVIPIIGAPVSLIYNSANIKGKISSFTLDIPAIGASLPSGVSSVAVQVDVAGRTFNQNYTSANSTYHFVWDGLDASSNWVGESLVHVTITPNYSGPGEMNPTELWYTLGIGVDTANMGYWRISGVHALVPQTNSLWMSDGSYRTVEPITLSPSGYQVASLDGSEVYVFDSDGYHTQTLDPKTGSTRLTIGYDSSHRIISLTDAFGNVTTINRNSSGIPTTIVGPYGQTTTLGFSLGGELTSVTGPDSSVYAMTYSSTPGMLHTFTKPSGEVSTMVFSSPSGDLYQESSSSGASYTYTTLDSSLNGWDWRHATVETSALGRVRTQTYSDKTAPMGGKTITDSSNFSHTRYYYDQKTDGTLGAEIDSYSTGSGVTKSYSADARFGVQSNFISSLNLMEGYNESSTQTLSPIRTDPNLNLPMAAPFSYTTLETNRTINGNTYQTIYTKSSGDNQITSPLGRIAHVVENALGQVTQTSLASFSAINYSYDTHGRLSGISQGTRASAFSYNSLGLLSSATDPASQTTSYTYDTSNRLASVTLPDSRVISYSYDSGGNISSITTPSTIAHLFTNNFWDVPTSYQAPSLGSGTLDTTYTYNNDKQLTSITRPSGDVISFNYGSTTGNLDSITSGSSTYSNTYSWEGVFQSSTSPDGVTFTQYYTYNGIPYYSEFSGNGKGTATINIDANLNLSSFQIGSGTTYTFQYNNDALLTKTGNETVTRTNSTGLIASTSIGNAKEYYTYDSTYGEVASYQAKYSATNKFLEQYTRDDLGRISARTVTIGTGTPDVYAYTYDSAGRLTDVIKNSISVGHYVYDSNSNRTSSTNSAGTFAATYDAQDRLSTYGTVTFGYNLNGERTSRVDSSLSPGTTNYTWDAFGNLKQVALPSGTQINYKYDGFNRKVTRLTGATVNERYVYLDQTHLLGVLNSSGSTVMTFFYGTRNTPEYMIKSGTTYKFFVDHVGSVRQIINTSTGTVAQELTYDEFGRVLSDTSPGFQPFGFAGGLYDSSTGLTQFGARWYDAEVGRFLSKDPILFAGGDTNLYGYVLNDTINLIDPSGLKPGDVFPSVDAAVADAFNHIGKKGDHDTCEYGGQVVKSGSGFTYNSVIRGDANGVSLPSNYFGFGPAVADFHTHLPNSNHDIGPSATDENNATLFSRVPGYVLSPFRDKITVFTPPPIFGSGGGTRVIPYTPK